ncbi:MAG: acetylornithine transaminase [Proteobacteria bacterium]|nr:acetylornithine transaminase [Pseudomonadota bacterium]
MAAAGIPGLMSNYGRMDVTFSHGRGAWLWDTEGRPYLDALSGIAVCGLGHAHPDVTAAIAAQATRLLHTSNLYRVERQEQLATRLCALSGMDRVFFCNSGAEANEAAIKIARKFGHEKGVARPAVIVTDGSFHGRTLATLSATGNAKVHAGFEPLVEGFVRVPYDDVDAVGNAAGNADVVAVLVEPVEGEGGIVVPEARYLAALRKICDDRGILLMLDEVQTGMGRTGRWFAHQHHGIVPDVMTLAKGLGNGVPIGACVARGAAAEVLQPGTHGSTFGGNPLVSAAALAVIDTMERDGLVQRAGTLGARMVTEFKHALAGNKAVVSIRGHGLMLGIELDRGCYDLVKLALAQGLLINVTADKTVRLLPPLILSDDEARQVVTRVAGLINEFTGHAA